MSNNKRSPSQLLRDAIYGDYLQKKLTLDFEVYYKQQMEIITNWIKNKKYESKN